MDFHRRSIRLKGHDYSKGVYFVTIDVQDKLKLFWNDTQINNVGIMLSEIVKEIPRFYPGIEVDEYVVMPDHIHLIIEILDSKIVGADPRIRPNMEIGQMVVADPRIRPNMEIGQTQGSARTLGRILSLSEVVQRFKALTTKRYIEGVRNNNWPKFNGRLWQRNYYEEIIRSKEQLENIRQYIHNNPKKL